MITIKNQEEYEVWCKNCKKTITFDSPDGLTKEINLDSKLPVTLDEVLDACIRGAQKIKEDPELKKLLYKIYRGI